MSERKKHFIIGKRIAAIIGALFAVAAASLVVAANQWIKKDALEEARIQARIILDRNLAIHAYFNKQLKPELLSKLKEEIDKGYFEPSWMSSTYAIREINKFSKTFSQYDYYYKECAINARSPENEADKYERAFIERLNADPELIENDWIRDIDGKPFFVVLRRGETMEESCLRCHSNPDAAPAGLIEHYNAKRSFGRRAKEVVSAVSIRVPLEMAFMHANHISLGLSLFFIFTLSCLFFVQIQLHKRLFLSPLEAVNSTAKQIIADKSRIGEEIPMPDGLELRELVSTFNAASAGIKKSMADAQKQRLILQGVIDSSEDIIFSMDRLYRYTSFNKRHAKFVKAVVGEEPSIGANPLKYTPTQEDRDVAKRNMDKALAGEAHTAEIFFGKAQKVRFQISHNPLRAENGEVVGVAVLARDITERDRNEDISRSRMRILEAAYNPDASLDDLLRASLDEIEALTGSSISFYHFLEEDGETLSLQMWSTNTVNSLCTAEAKGLHYKISDAGVWADCVRRKKPLIHNDYSSLPNRKGLPEGHAPVIRELTAPIVRGSRIVAAIGVGNKPVDYDEADVRIVSLLGDFSWEIVSRKLAEQQRLAGFAFAANMDKINRAIQAENDPDGLMREVLDLTLLIFDCDQAFLLYPCDPEASEWAISMERTKVEYPGLAAQGITTMPMDDETANLFRVTLNSGGQPVSFGRDADHPLPGGLLKRLNVNCSLETALFPKTGKPWQFGIRNCSGMRVWSKEEVKLFREIAFRLENALTSMLFLSDLKESREELRRLNAELEQRVAERTAELEDKNLELEKINRLFVGREKKMAELKKKIKTLENRCREEGSSR